MMKKIALFIFVLPILVMFGFTFFYYPSIRLLFLGMLIWAFCGMYFFNGVR